jgi:1-acyl-sn-glycerol-3-phosphate acyltransferase
MTPSPGPQSSPSLVARFWTSVLRVSGWSLAFRAPDFDRYVLIVAPHTSNWDFPLGMAAAWALQLHARFMGKHTLFKPPFGWLFSWMGGIPVKRDSAGDTSTQMARRFASESRLVLALAPEGTRSTSDHWKSGFWHIARTSGVPIVMAYIDYSRKEIGGGTHFMPSDSIEADFDLISDFYASKQGKNPDQQSRITHRRPNT